MNRDDTPLPAELPPLQINPSAIRALLLMLIRVVGIVVTAIGTLAAFVATRDLAGFIIWIKSEDFPQFLTAIGLLVSFGSSAWITLRNKAITVQLARKVDDKVAVVLEPTPRPSVEAIVPPPQPDDAPPAPRPMR